MLISNNSSYETIMKNKPIDLNNHLFAALERLSAEELKGDALKEEIERSRAISGLAKQVIDQQKNIIEAEKLKTEFPNREMPLLLQG